MILHRSLRNRKISDYLDGNLSESAKLQFEKHLEHCKSCSKKVQFLQLTQQLVQAPNIQFDSITESVMGRIKEKKWNTSNEIIGNIQTVIGNVAIRTGTNGNDLEAFPDCALRKGDTLHTVGESKVLVDWNDGSQLYINKDTELDLHTSSYPLTLRLGKIFSIMKPQLTPFEIKTPSAVISVIGTDFDTEVNKKNQTILKVLKGKVAFKNKSGEVLVKKNQQVEASEYTMPNISPIKESQAINKWIQSISPNRTNGGIMKKVLASIIIVAVIGIGGYIVHSQTTALKPLSKIVGAKVIEAPSSISNENIRLEYVIDPQPFDPQHRSVISVERQWSPETKIKSPTNIQTLILHGNIFPSAIISDVVSDTVSWNIETDPLLNKKRFNFYLKFPYNEPRENVLDLLAKEFGFTYFIEDSTIIGYRATWNGQPILSSNEKSNEGSKFGKIKTSYDTNGKITNTQFSDIDINEILGQYKDKYHIRIKDETGLKGVFNGTFQFPPSLDDAKEDLKKQTGIELKAYDLPVKKLTVKAK